MPLSRSDRDLVVDGYIACALWSSMDGSDPDTGGDPLDDTYHPWDIAKDSMDAIRADVETFLDRAGPLAERLVDEGLVPAADYIGHDLWLTRNHHGTGFWDRGLPGTMGDELTAIADSIGEASLVIGDDGDIHQERG